jgi:hypothetical protein
MKKNHHFFVLLLIFALLASGCSAPKISTFFTFAPGTTRAVSPETLTQAQKVLQKRLAAFLSGKSVVQVENAVLRVGLANENDLPTAIALATEPGQLVFFHSDTILAAGAPLPANPTVILTGADIIQAKASLDSTTNQWGIEFKLSPAGKTRLAEYTAAHVGAYLVIALDGQVISAPRINAAITGGSAVIQADFDQATAGLLAAVLTSGALPVPLKVVK